MKGIILAAGRGKRLRPLTDTLPKPMIRLGGKPLLEHILLKFKAVGVKKILIVVGHLAENIEEYFDNGERWQLELSYITQEKADGNGSALLLAEDFVGQDIFMMSWGDILTDLSEYVRMVERFNRESCSLLSALNYMDDPSTGAANYVENGRIVRIVEKPPPGTSVSHWNQAGIFIIKSIIFGYLHKIPISPRGEREFTSAVQMMINEGLKVCGLEMERPRFELSRPEDVERFDLFF